MTTEDSVKPQVQKDEKFEAFLDAYRDIYKDPLSDGAKDSARMAFYGKVYSKLYDPVHTSPYPHAFRMLSPVHSVQDSSAGMKAFYEFMASVGDGYPLPGRHRDVGAESERAEELASSMLGTSGSLFYRG